METLLPVLWLGVLLCAKAQVVVGGAAVCPLTGCWPSHKPFASETTAIGQPTQKGPMAWTICSDYTWNVLIFTSSKMAPLQCKRFGNDA